MVNAQVSPASDVTGAESAARAGMPETDQRAGIAHVATASFLTSRVVPTGGFVVALAGGSALARLSQRTGLRTGYGASIAATLQAIAVMGPSRLGVPLTQALSAPLVGRLRAFWSQFLVCGAIRLCDQLVAATFYIFIIAGGVEPFTATFETLAGWIPIAPQGVLATLAVTAAALVAWTLFASTVQVLVYRAALRSWSARDARPATTGSDRGRAANGARARDLAPSAGSPATGAEAGRSSARGTSGAAPSAGSPATGAGAGDRRSPRYDPRAVTVAAIVGFVVLLTTTAWPVLAAVALWLAIAWATARADRAPVRSGLALTALLAGSALAFGLIGGMGVDIALRRAVRAGLLVLVATWLRAAAGEDGLREVGRRTLTRLRRVPSTVEAAAIFAHLGADGSLAASGRALVEELRHVSRRPVAIATGVLRWAAREVDTFTVPPRMAPAVLRVRAHDWAVLAGVVAGAAVGFAAV